jgi:MFS transporter, DHA1 family, inner membrane transport protein
MWFRIMILAVGTFALGTDVQVIAGILPTIAYDMAVPVATTGLLVTVFALTYALGSPTLATLTGSVARKRLLIGSLGVFVGANVLAAVALNFGILVLARILAAGGAALYTPTASAVAATLAPAEKRGRALALVLGGITLAAVLGVPIGTLVGTLFGWRMTFVLVAVMGALAACGILLFFPVVATPPSIGLRARLALFQQPRIVVTLGLTVLSLMGLFTVYPYLALLFQHITHLGGTGISAMFLVFGVASVVGNVLGGYGADRWGPVRTMVMSLAISGIALVVLPLVATSVLGAAATLIMLGSAAWMFTAPQQQRLLALAPESPAVILSLNASASYVGMGSGAAIGGLVLHAASMPALGWVGGVCEVLALVVLILSTHLHRRRAGGSKPEVRLADDERQGAARSQLDEAVLS